MALKFTTTLFIFEKNPVKILYFTMYLRLHNIQLYYLRIFGLLPRRLFLQIFRQIMSEDGERWFTHTFHF